MPDSLKWIVRFKITLGNNNNALKRERRSFMYTLEEIKQKIVPIAKAHNLKAVYLIGSYARGEATADSDIDFLFDGEGSNITSLVKASSMYADIRELFNVPVDLVNMATLRNPRMQRTSFLFIKNVERDKVKIYDRT